MVALRKALNKHRADFAKILPFNAAPNEILNLDLSAKNKSLLIHKVIDNPVLSEFISAELTKSNAKIAIIGYLEDRLIYTLLGHLSTDCLKNIEPEQVIDAGEAFAEIGNARENGQWLSHLHFQLISNMQNYKDNYPGVCNIRELNKYKTLCPDPMALLKL